jgi:NADPH2:quinone reductase
MKAVLCTGFGPASALKLAELPDPVPGPGQVVVAIKAAALNFFDTLLIAGKYQRKPPFPFSPAAEFAGTVETVGADVADLQTGDRVVGYVGHGAARERLAVAADRLVKVPPALDLDRAAGLTVSYGTTLHALKDRGDLKAGETLAVLGAAGGTGVAAVELGKLMGARVIACASSDEKLAFARDHGADALVNYETADLKEALRQATGGVGADVIYDPVGGRYAEPALRALASEGRYLVVGFAAGEIPRLPLNLLLLKNADLRGVQWGVWSERNLAAHRKNLAALLAWAAEGRLRAHIHAVYPLSAAAEALEAISARQPMGKILLRP